MMTSDEDLMLEVKDGSEEAFSELVARYERPLISYFFRQGWDQGLAEDCAQEVFLRVFRARTGYAPQAKFRTYLFRIARNLWIDHVRARRTKGSVISLSQPSGDGDRSDPLSERISGDEPPPSAQMRREDLRLQIRNAVDFLSEDQKAVFLLCEVEGMRYAEVAEILGIPVGTVKSRMHTASTRIREHLKKKKLGPRP